MSDLLPNSSWLVKDNNKSIKEKSRDVKLPLSKDDEQVMKKLITFVKFSQDKEKNKNKIVKPAAGLAAPQIGYNIKMYYIKLSKKSDDNDRNIEFALINPKIIGRTHQQVALQYGEGCLSVDHEYEGYVNRSYKIIVEGYDYFKKEKVRFYAVKYEAIVIQHEQDHLEGKLYYEHINKKSPWKKETNIIYL